MPQIHLKDWLEIIGMTAIVASLVFVGLQVKQDRSIATVDSFDGVANSYLQLADLMSSNAELWRRGLDGEELTLDEKIHFRALAKAVESSFLISWRRALELDVYDADSELRDYAMALHMHPGLRAAFESKQARYAMTDQAFGLPADYGAFGKAVTERLQHLDNNPVPVTAEKSYVFWD